MKAIIFLLLTVVTFASAAVAQDKERTPRFELGAQFTLLSVHAPLPVPQSLVILNGDTTHTEPGLGGRFTFNLKLLWESAFGFSFKQRLCLKNRESHLDRVSTGCDSDLVKPSKSETTRNIAC